MGTCHCCRVKCQDSLGSQHCKKLWTVQYQSLRFLCVQVSKLHKLLKPFLLRRIKSDVEDSLPAKQEILLYADMTKEQKKINQQLCDRSFIVSCPPALRYAAKFC